MRRGPGATDRARFGRRPRVVTVCEGGQPLARVVLPGAATERQREERVEDVLETGAPLAERLAERRQLGGHLVILERRDEHAAGPLEGRGRGRRRGGGPRAPRRLPRLGPSLLHDALLVERLGKEVAGRPPEETGCSLAGISRQLAREATRRA
jgi:hypothetical protein